MVDFLSALAIGSGIASGAGGLISAINPPSQGGGISSGDVLANLDYHRAATRISYHSKRKERLKQAKEFQKFANIMGVSRYALLGNAPTATAQPSGTVAPTTTSDPGGSAWANAGQDVARGVNSIIAASQAMSQNKVNDAQARVLNAQADSLVNQSQKPISTGIVEEDLPLSKAHPGKRLWEQEEGKNVVKPYLHGRIVRHLPDQNAADFISEDMPAKIMFYKDRVAYAQRMNRGYNAKNMGRSKREFLNEKRKLEWYFKRPLKWSPSVRIKSRFLQKDIFGAWVLK